MLVTVAISSGMASSMMKFAGSCIKPLSFLLGFLSEILGVSASMGATIVLSGGSCGFSWLTAIAVLQLSKARVTKSAKMRFGAAWVGPVIQQGLEVLGPEDGQW